MDALDALTELLTQTTKPEAPTPDPKLQPPKGVSGTRDGEHRGLRGLPGRVGRPGTTP